LVEFEVLIILSIEIVQRRILLVGVGITVVSGVLGTDAVAPVVEPQLPDCDTPSYLLFMVIIKVFEVCWNSGKACLLSCHPNGIDPIRFMVDLRTTDWQQYFLPKPES